MSHSVLPLTTYHASQTVHCTLCSLNSLFAQLSSLHRRMSSSVTQRERNALGKLRSRSSLLFSRTSFKQYGTHMTRVERIPSGSKTVRQETCSKACTRRGGAEVPANSTRLTQRATNCSRHSVRHTNNGRIHTQHLCSLQPFLSFFESNDCRVPEWTNIDREGADCSVLSEAL